MSLFLLLYQTHLIFHHLNFFFLIGLIRTARLLDRETKPEFKLIAVAQDGGGLNCTTSVLVYLNDVNDNPPVFGPGSLRESYSIQEDAKIRTLLTRVAAQDADIGEQCPIIYPIIKLSHTSQVPHRIL